MRNGVASLLGTGSHSVTKWLETVALVGHSAKRNQVVELGGIMTTGEPTDSRVAEIIERALQLAEDALEQITRIAVEQIRRGVESSNHIEAAERDMRSALRQLVLAQREWHQKPAPRVRLGEHVDVIADVGANSPPPRSGASG